MKNIAELAELIRDYGSTFYGSETPEYVASQWVEALPQASLSDIREWLDWGFWDPYVVQELSDAKVSPWDVPEDAIYDLCNGDLGVETCLRGKEF